MKTTQSNMLASLRTRESLRTELLQFHMAPINRIAKLKLSTAPELASFLMPRSKLPIQRLKGFAHGMPATGRDRESSGHAHDGRRMVHVLNPLVRQVIGKDPGLLKN